MLRCYRSTSGKLIEIDWPQPEPAEPPVAEAVASEAAPAPDTEPNATTGSLAASPKPLTWVDLLNPGAEEARKVEALLDIEIPTRAEASEIELSARLYHEDDAEFMTVTALANLEGEEPVKTPITFILKGPTLVTVRYAEPRSFQSYALRAQRPSRVSSSSGELVMLGLIETLIDRIADALERISDDIDTTSRAVFGTKGSAQTVTRDLQAVLEQIGHKGDLITKIQESLVSLGRLTAYHSALEMERRKMAKSRESRQRLRLIQRDATQLGDYAISLSNKVNFLLDATLGLINLEQNAIIKIFSVAAVVFLPPTLVASIYGMNFAIMPELHLPFGYPMALGLMVISAVLPYLYFRRKGWL